MKSTLPALQFTLFVGLAASWVQAQAVLGVSPPTASSQSVLGASPPSGAAPTYPLWDIRSILSRPGPLVQWGILAVRPHLDYGIRYGNGILRVPGEPENTWMHTVSPGVLLELGQRWTVDYTATRNFYSSRLLEDTTNHNASLQGGARVGDLQLGISQQAGVNSPSLVETGTQTRERTYSTHGSAAYDLTSRTSLELSGTYGRRKANPLTRSPAWTGSDWVQTSASGWLRHVLSPRLNVAAGYMHGYDEVSDNPDMEYSQPQVQLTVRATDKVNVSARVGYQTRTSKAQGDGENTNFVYNSSLQYSPFLATSISLSASQTVSSSYFSDQSTRSRNWGLSLSQRLLKRFFMSASFSVGETTYLDTNAFRPTGRADRYESFNIGVSTPVASRGSVSFSYQHSENRSSNRLFGFATNQYAANFSYSF